MNHPVLLPKRKDFGFLKPNKLGKTGGLITPFRLSKTKEFIETSRPINLTNHVNALQIRYDVRNSAPTENRISDSSFESPNRPARSPNISYSSVNIDLKKEHFERQAYNTSTGTNIKNLKRNHHLLNVTNRVAKTAQPQLQAQNNYVSTLNELEEQSKTNIILNCNNCGRLNLYGNDCISCRYRSRVQFDSLNLPKFNKKKIQKDMERLRTMSSIQTSSGDGLEDRSQSTLPTVQRSAATDQKNRSNFSSNDNAVNSLLIDNNNFETYEEPDDDIIPKLTLWLV